MYDGKIYEIGNRYALRLEAGTFHFVEPAIIEQAFNEGFILGWEGDEIFNEMEETPIEFINFITA